MPFLLPGAIAERESADSDCDRNLNEVKEKPILLSEARYKFVESESALSRSARTGQQERKTIENRPSD